MSRARLQEALDAFAAVHATDPRIVGTGDRVGTGNPGDAGSPGGTGEAPLTHSQRYHRALDRWVRKLAETPSEALLLAAGCQHLRRWEVPRNRYPEGRAGYKRWRTDLLARHAEQGGEMLRALGFEEALILRMQALVTKQDLQSNPEMQLFEDAICLAFLECELLEFAAGQSDKKLARILRKTWRKMTAQGQGHARDLLTTLPAEATEQVGEALRLAKLG